jgi:predicted nucleotidyltransferase
MELVSTITQNINFSNNIIKKIVSELKASLYNDNICVITTGSFAREEASKESDMDYFVVVRNGDDDLPIEERKIIVDIVNKHVSKDSGDTGTFGDDAIENLEDMLKNIGGSEDTNIKITRRMLLLLESKSLYNNSFYDDIIENIISIYIKNIKKEQIARFLLNDIIRYYRTITIDFEFKTSESGKCWGLRNIKLTYSRKLIYFVGILMVAKTQDLEKAKKLNILICYINMTPIERIEKIVSNDKLKEDIVNLYNFFLEQISDKSVRDGLNSIVDINDEKNESFTNLKSKSKEFSKVLKKAIGKTFNNNHRIHEAIIL